MKRRQDDALWKGLLENVFDDFLTFFFENADKVFDYQKGFTYLDKELAELFPGLESKSARHVDKLVKVFTSAGNEQWILVHIEVQGQQDSDFALRMFTYYYRILDKYRLPVTAIAIFTDAVKAFHPTSYEQSFMGTGNRFYFNTYKVLDQKEAELEKNTNPFSVAILTVLLALKAKSLNDEKLFSLKYKLVRNLYRRKISQAKIDGLMLFIQLYVSFEKPEYNLKFEKAIDELNEHKTTMGIREFVLERAKQEGKMEASMQKETDFVKSLILQTDFSDEKISELVGVTVGFVKEIRTAKNS